MTMYRMKKRAIKILNPAGGSWTSVKQAIKWVEQGRARYIDETSIEMIESDHRHLSAARSIAAPVSPSSGMIGSANPTSPTLIGVSYDYTGPENLRTFAPYPDVMAGLRNAA